MTIKALTTLLLISSVFSHPIGTPSSTEDQVPSHYPVELVQNCRLHWYIPGCNISVLFDGYKLSPKLLHTAETWLDEYIDSLTLNHTKLERGLRLIDCFHEKHFNVDFKLFDCYADALIDDRLGLLGAKQQEHGEKDQGKPIEPTTATSTESITTETFTQVESTTALNITVVHDHVIEDDHLKHYESDDGEEYKKPAHCPPVEPMIHLWYEEKPSKEQINFCWRNPTRCPMRLTLFGLNLQRQHIDIFQQWLDYYRDNKPIDPCDDDYDEEEAQHEQGPQQLTSSMIRSLKLITCINNEPHFPYYLLPCLRHLLEEYGIPINIAQDETHIHLQKDSYTTL